MSRKIRPMTEEERQLIQLNLSYDPETGSFTHRIDKRGGRVKAGSMVKTKPSRDGYLHIGVGGIIYLAHRLAWLLTYGEWPDMQVDHKDHVRTNNRIDNLRLVTPQGNKMNETLRADNTSGTTGVCWNKREGKWSAYVYQNRKLISLGYFHAKDEAITARAKANDNFGFHENHGKPRAVGVA